MPSVEDFRCIADLNAGQEEQRDVRLCNGDEFAVVVRLPARPSSKQTVQPHYRCIACGARYRLAQPDPSDLATVATARPFWQRVE